MAISGGDVLEGCPSRTCMFINVIGEILQKAQVRSTRNWRACINVKEYEKFITVCDFCLCGLIFRFSLVSRRIKKSAIDLTTKRGLIDEEDCRT